MIIVDVNEKQWDEEHSDSQAQIYQTEHDVKVGVDTVSKNEEWIFNDLTLTLWHLDLHLFEKCFSQSMLEIRLLLFALSKARK